MGSIAIGKYSKRITNRSTEGMTVDAKKLQEDRTMEGRKNRAREQWTLYV
jgi:hypothetical protein